MTGNIAGAVRHLFRPRELSGYSSHCQHEDSRITPGLLWATQWRALAASANNGDRHAAPGERLQPHMDTADLYPMERSC